MSVSTIPRLEQIQKAEEQKRMEVLTREFVYDDLFEMVTHTPYFTINCPYV